MITRLLLLISRMAKLEIYKNLFETKSIQIKDFKLLKEGTRPHDIQINRALSNPILFDNITLLIENLIKTKNIEFDRICATSTSAIPYATNVATSFEKSIAFISNLDSNPDHPGMDQIPENSYATRDYIKNIKIEGGLQIDERVILIETVVGNDFHLENIIQKIRKYGGVVVGVIVILNICEGEYCNLLSNKELVMPVLNLFDIMTYLENNNMVEMFYTEKIKFYCEKETKNNIKKLIPPIAEVFDN